MSAHPMLLRGPLVRAVLEGRKTQTRRPMTFRNSLVDGVPVSARDWADLMRGRGYASWSGMCQMQREVDQYGQTRTVQSRVAVGDTLWVREAFAQVGGRVVYRADCPDGQHPDVPAWKPSIHMPRAACRLELSVTKVRYQRVESIGTQDAIAEGVEPIRDPAFGPRDMRNATPSYRAGFLKLWRALYPDHGNGHVWVIHFTAKEAP